MKIYRSNVFIIGEELYERVYRTEYPRRKVLEIDEDGYVLAFRTDDGGWDTETPVYLNKDYVHYHYIR